MINCVKSFHKSKKTPAKNFLLSIPFAILLIGLINACQAVSKPKLLLDKIIFSVKYLEVRFYSIFSNNFEKAGSIEISL